MMARRLGWLALCALLMVACDDGTGDDPGADRGVAGMGGEGGEGGAGGADAGAGGEGGEGGMGGEGGVGGEGGEGGMGGEGGEGGMGGEGGEGGMGGVGGEGGMGGEGGVGGMDARLDVIIVTPAELTLVAGQTALVQAMGRYTDGAEVDLTAEAEWTSTRADVAALGQTTPEGRQVVALGDGETQISARVGGVVGAATVAVTAVRPVSLRVEPDMASVAAGETVAFRAFATFNDDNEAEVTGRAEWRSTNPIVAEASNADGARGQVTTFVAGSTRITALFEGLVSAPVDLEVTAAALAALAVTPADPTGSLGEQIRLIATATYTDGSSRALAAGVEWTSSAPEVVAVDPTGLATLLAVGEARVTARVGEIVAPPQTISVRDARVVGLTVDGEQDTLVVGTQVALTATARLSDGSDADYSGRVEWRSSDEDVARVDANGTVTGVGAGEAEISAAFEGVESDTFAVTVEAVAVTGLAVEPDSLTVAVAEVAQLTARAQYNDGTTADVTAQVEWQSANPVVATVGNGGAAGVVTGASAGDTRITARLDAFAAAADVTVTAAPLVALTIAPLDVELPLGGRQVFTAMATYGDGVERDVTGQAEWRVSDAAVLQLGEGATRSRVTAIGEGEAEVVAELDGISTDAAVVTVVAAVVEAVRIEPAAPRIIIGETFQLTAVAITSDGAERDVTDEVSWTVIDEDVATVSNRPESRGLVEALAIGETTIRATLGELLSAPAMLTVLPVPNRAPDVTIDCPESGREGEALDFSARGSSDPDGEIVRFLWTFGAAPPLDVGDSVDVSYTFMTSGPIDVELTAEDDDGARATARCTVQIQSADAPTVRFVRPQGTRETTQGAEIDVLVDARPGPGRDITGVSLLLDGEEVATAEAPPYEMTFTVPIEAATGATLRLVARAVDDRGDAGVSTAVLLDVVNDLPVPNFVAVPTDLRRVTVDASGVVDDTTDPEALEVRWDWEDDGVYDTAFDVAKVAQHEYPAEGEYVIRMQVRDNVGQTASATRLVRFVDRQVVSGDIESQVWAGTILVTGDVRLLPGHTLTIVAGTSVQVAHVDQDDNGVGDYDITIDGTVQVQGEPNEPVVFTVFGNDDRAPGAWEGLRITGAPGSVVRHAIIEFANDAIFLEAPAVVEDTRIQQSRRYGVRIIGAGSGSRLSDVTISETGDNGVQMNNALDITVERLRVTGGTSNINAVGSRATFTDLVSRDARQSGVRWSGGALTITGAEIAENGCDGLHITDAALDLSGLRVERNACVGAFMQGSTSGLLTRSHLIENARAGVTAIPLLARDPTVAILRNNIHSNGAAGSTRYTIASNPISASDGSSNGQAVTSGNYDVPAGSQAQWVEYQVSISGGYRGQGELIGDGRVLGGTGNSGTYQLASNARRFQVRARMDQCCDGTATTYLRRVFYATDVEEPLQLVVARRGGTIDARENYLGRYPDILPALSFSSSGDVDIQGFVGVPYDDDFDTGPYYGGRTIDEPIEWAGVVYVSGDVLIGAGGGLTVAPGTEIRVAPIDQNGNGQGDFSVQIDGPSTLGGTAEAPIVVRTDAPDSAPYDWDRFHLHGDAITATHLVIEGARVGLMTDGAVEVRDAELRDNYIGAEIRDGAPLFERLSAHDNQSTGVVNRGGATLRVVRIEDNGGHGLELAGAASTGEDLLISGNGLDGVHITSRGHVLDYVEITDNGHQGVSAIAAAGGTITHCSVTFNGGAGIHAVSDADDHPLLAVTGCNVFGNANQEGGVGVDVYLEATPNFSVSDASSNGQAVTSGFYDADEEAYEVQFQVSITGGYRGQGQLLNPNSSLLTFTSSAIRWVDVTTNRFRVNARMDQCCDGTTTSSIRRVRQRIANQQNLEMSLGVYGQDRVDARGNYWGVFPNVQDRIAEGLDGSSDFTGFVPDALRGVGPRALP